MPESNNKTENNTHEVPQPGDPRHSYAVVTMAMRELIDGVGDDQLSNATACPEFSVRELLDHVVFVQRRVAAIGQGEHFSAVQEESIASGWGEEFVQAAGATRVAWSDPSLLDGTYEVPWGELPGVIMMWIYTAELAVHGWDLASATGQALAIDDEILQTALEVVKEGVPAENRDLPDVPFSAVIDPGPNASVLLQLAGWAGRNVLD